MDTVNLPSPKWSLNNADVRKWLKNAAIFLAPLAIIYLVPVASNLQDGFAWSDFALTPVTEGAIVLYVVNTALDFFRKLIAGPTQ